MGQLIEVVALTLEPDIATGRLLGAGIDGPTPGLRVAAAEVEISGWVLDAEAAEREVELCVGGRVLARAPVEQDRPDIAAAFPDHPLAAGSGYRVALDASALASPSDVELRARRADGSEASIGRLELRRLWRACPPDVARLVTVVVVCERVDAPAAATVDSVAGQGYWPLEIFVAPRRSDVAPPERFEQLAVRAIAAPDPSAAALRNEAIRLSSGGVVLFAHAGALLAPDAVDRAMAILDRRPELVGLVDGPAGADVAAAMYRRSAFEELRGFEDPSDERCDSNLAQRAAARFDLHREAGVLVQRSGD